MPKPPRVYATPGIVLRQRKLGETDKIVTLYTANFGKLDAVAKGVRRLTSKLAGHVEPLNHGSYQVARGRNLDIVTQAQTIESFAPLRKDLERLSRALYVAEVVDVSTEERADNFALYRLLLDTLRRLVGEGDLDLALRYFEMALLDLLGYRPELVQCVVCGRALPDAAARWVAGLGGVVCADCRPADVPLRHLSRNALHVLRILQREGFAEIARLQVASDLSAELERTLREALHYALDRDLRSASFLDAVRRRVDRATTPAAGLS